MKQLFARSALMTSVAVAGAMVAGQAHAEEKSFDIPQQQVQTAIASIAHQANIQVIAARRITQGKQTRALYGNIEVEAAFTRMLEGTGLVARRSGPQTWTILADAGAARGKAPALAQETPPRAAASAPLASSDNADIVVTARKVAEPASRTPLAMSIATGADLRQKGVVSVQNLDKVAPNVVIDRQASGINITLRGVGTTDTTSRASPGIATVIDGIQQMNNRVLGLAFFDIDHVEVLRGPQGTLYGASSPGGVVRVISNRPDFKPEVAATAEIGNYNTYRATVTLNQPISDTLALRVAGASNDRDGYIIQTNAANPALDARPGIPITGALNDQHDKEGRIGLLYKPDGTTSALIQVTAAHSYGHGYSSVPVADWASASSGVLQRTVPANPINAAIDDTYIAVNGELATEFAGIKASYLGGYSHTSMNDITTDSSGTNDGTSAKPNQNLGYIWALYRGPDATQSHELRLQNAAPGRLNWTVGASYLKRVSSSLSGNYGTPVTTSTAAQTMANSTVTTLTQDAVSQQNLSIFGTVDVRLTEKLRLSVGGRYGTDKVRDNATAWQTTAEVAGCQPFKTCPVPGTAQGGTLTTHKFTYRVSADYQLNSANMIYADIATGYKPGGFNYVEGLIADTATYQPEKLTAYEIGYKGHPFKGVYIDSSAFYYDYASYQVVAAEEIRPAVGISVTKSTPVRIYGIENNLSWQVTHDDSLKLSVNYLSARFRDLQAGSVPNLVDWSGYSLNNAPFWTISGGIRHDFHLTNDGRITFTADTAWTSKYDVNNIGGAQQYIQPAFTRTNLSITYNAPRERYSVGLFVSNLEDKVQQTYYMGPPVQGFGNIAITEPRFFGMRLGLKL